MESQSDPTFEARGWASYVTFDKDLAPETVQDKNAKYSANEREYAAQMTLVAPNQVRVSPAEDIDASDYYVLLNDLAFTDGARISSEVLAFGPGQGSGS
ncbi:hypothetical protein [Nitrospirillum viridazoti]|uniref:Uncharacterized protein n=1 Tax=Nitrospirillum viridazoti CBAmc TaxID=1441467 RepID=A0A248JZ79_9PROT|nr:hypothetical protein [Nitrospirillum amazonense]ASG24015.1 hypothetical protein Y958_24040 [Nitrospirillum amazonense CBAmc]TWB44538.1 hypothetical protein FBZ91_1019 [Nitrospirillum amazonense]